MKLYKYNKSTYDDDYIYLKNSEIYNDYNIQWYSGYFTFYFPVESRYSKDDIYFYTCKKARLIRTSKYFSTFFKRLRNEII